MITRHLAARLRRSKKSVLLLGPRQTGKSTLVHALQPDLAINLAHEPTYLQFARNPAELEERLAVGTARTVFIDEIQRLPSLLNTIQEIGGHHAYFQEIRTYPNTSLAGDAEGRPPSPAAVPPSGGTRTDDGVPRRQDPPEQVLG